MKAKELIEALSALNPDAEVLINVKQYNKVYGVIQLKIDDTKTDYGSYVWVNHNYSGATIHVKLPEGAYIAGIKPKK